MDALTLARHHEAWRLGRCLNLMASENVTSPEVRTLLASDFAHRYTLPIGSEVHGSYVENAYRGTRYTDAVEARGEALARQIFGARHATLKPLGGHIAGMIMLLSACRRGDNIMVLHPDHGGYDGYAEGYLPDILGLGVSYLPFDEATWRIRSEEAAAMIAEGRPRLVIVGQSFFPFPYELRPLVRACRSAGSLLGYDGSHVLGLIAGHEFQDPLGEGVDVLVGSTHKSFFGPQGGLLLTNHDELWAAVQRNLVWRSIDNAHWNRIAALARALEEAKRYGRRYARQVVANSRALGASLDGLGFPLRFGPQGFTHSHQLILDLQRLRRDHGLTANDFAVRCEANDIIVDAVGRLGTNEVTRMGAKESHMRSLATLLTDVLHARRVKGRVHRIRASLHMAYTLQHRRSDRQG